MTYIIVSDHARARSFQRLGTDSLLLIRRLWREGKRVSKAEMRGFNNTPYIRGYVYRIANYANGRVLIVAAPMGLGIKVVTVIWRPLERGEE